MALTRGRAVASDRSFKSEVEGAILDVLRMERDARKIAADVADMRGKLASEKGESNPWDIKFAKGGLIDLEFIAQYLQLVHAHRHPQVLNASTANVLESAYTAGLLAVEDHEVLRRATKLQHDLTQVLRLCLSGPFEPEKAGEGVKSLLARAGSAPDFVSLDAELREVQDLVRGIFDRLIVQAA